MRDFDGQSGPDSGICTVSVGAKVLLATPRVGAFNDDGFNRCFEQLLVDYVGPGDYYRERSQVALRQDRLLGAVIGAVGGVFPHFFHTESRFAQLTICCLPAPVDRFELFTTYAT